MGFLQGILPCASLSEIEWGMANQYLKVEVKFENDFRDMGTMQFLAVPYALYAQKSLEPGPEGPKGDQGEKGEPGDPASDDQTLSVVNVDGSDYLAIAGGNQVKISSIERDGDPKNEIQDLVINSDVLKITNNSEATSWPLTRYLDNTDEQALTWDAANRVIGISGNPGTVNLSELENDADADPVNEIQDLQLNSGILSITGKTGAKQINMNAYLDNTDNQTLEYSDSTNSLSIDGGNSVTLGRMVAFRAEKVIPVGSTGTEVPLVFDVIRYNDGLAYNSTTGEFTAPIDGIYTFNVRYDAALGATISIYLDGQLYEKIADAISSSSAVHRSITMKLIEDNKIKVIVNTGMADKIGTGSFSGFKVY